MLSVNKRKKIVPPTMIIVFLSISLLLTTTINTNHFIAKTKSSNNTEQSAVLQPDIKEYRAEIHWVKTNIDLDNKGKGIVTILVNCTPEENHVGLLLGNFVENEITEFDLENSFAKTAGYEVDLNISSSGSRDYDYIFYLSETTHVNTSESILYQITYTGDFVLSGQLERFQVNPELAIINLVRPLWNITLPYQELTVVLPVDVSDPVVTPQFLNEIQFNVSAQMSTYDISYYKTGANLLVFNCSKTSMGLKAPFEATFYLSLAYFSLPNIMNWLVLLFVFIFIAGALVLFFVVINVRNQAETEVSEFQKDLHELLKSNEK